MTKSAMIRARVDPQLKDEVETILQELGLSTTQALTLFYQQIRLNRGIPFDLRRSSRLQWMDTTPQNRRSSQPHAIHKVFFLSPMPSLPGIPLDPIF